MDPVPPSLLLVEDDLLYAEGLKDRLELEGYRVATAATGAEALAQIRRDRFDLVLLDVMLPGMDGLQVCRAIKAESSAGFVPVIMVSARGAEEDRLLGLAEGADDYIPKPFSIRELLARIEALLRIKRAEDALRKQNRQLEALTAIAATVSRSLDLREILERALEKVMEGLEASRGVIHLLDEDRQELVYLTSRGLPETRPSREAPTIPIGEGIAGRAAEKGEPVWEIVPEPFGLFPSPPDGGEDHPCPAAAIPLISRGAVVGTLSLLVPSSTVFAADDLRFLSSVGRQIGLAVENARLYQQTDRELVRRVLDLSILNRMAEVASRSLSETEILEETLDTVMTLLTAQMGGIRLLDETTNDLILTATRGHPPTHSPKKARIRLGEGIPGQVALTGIPFYAPTVTPDPFAHREEPICRSRITVPLQAGERILGTLCLGNDRREAFTPEDVNLLTSIGRQLGISLENARLYQKMKEKALQLEALFETTQLLASSYRLEDALTLLARKAQEILGAIRVEITVCDEESHTVALRVASEGTAPPPPHIPAVLHTPIRIRDKESGVFSVSYTVPPPLEREEVELRETLARLAALAIEDTRLMTRSSLLQEVHHRVKNNLQTVASLLQLQISQQRSPGVKRAIRESIGRIKSIAIVHDLLSTQGDGETHLRDLLLRVSHLSAEEGKAPKQTHIVVQGPEISLPAREATALALAVNELVTNAVVHGLAGRGGEIDVVLSNTPSTLCVEVRDTGRGFPEGFSLATHAHLGLRIVEALVTKDLGGQVTFDPTAGTTVRVEFPLPCRHW